ncbi:MAG TPA: SDR family oxidoreductase [Polaromonas sp.]|uniref:SDR family NAD(P)-dependent oxidoreductase n=1 Tax=Polaromonas sp. TaxID=1869339 RepID=UPI002D65380B|nr:SDR family oxidoreductase [Polaromonas sp.]HYW57408.1 SDR family oxidoreductase [Polaromonas sp.]
MTFAVYPSLQRKVVFISGGSSGIGAELVKAFAAQGSQVAFCGTQPGGGDRLTEEATAAGWLAPFYEACDVRDVPALQAMLGRVADKLGPIQVLVNNAGRDDRHSLDELTPDYWDNCLNLNLRHQVFATQTVARQLKSAGLPGSIINMGSISWMRGRPNLIGYTSAKAAISGMTRSLARELGEHGIRVNALVPGAIVTERQTQLWRDPVEDQKFIDFQCLKFRLESVHVARPTLFLASDDSDGITGQNLLVDAGLAQVSVAG